VVRLLGATRNPRRFSHAPLVGQGLCLWLLATPYAHPHDDVLLLPALWLRASDRPATHVRALDALFAVTWWLLPMTSVLGLRLPGVRGLGVVPVILLALILTRRTRRAPKRAGGTTIMYMLHYG